MSEIWKPQPIDVYISWLDTIETEASDKLNDWESQFIGSIQTRLLNKINLTEFQAIKLEQIYVRHTS